MISHIVDDLFDMQFLSDLEEVILEIPIHTTNTANPQSFPLGLVGSHRLFGTDIFVRENINRTTKLHAEAEKFFDAFEIIDEHLFEVPVYLRRIDLNLQYYGQDGTPHTDGEGLTVMIMNNTRWDKEWGGQFQLVEVDDHHKVTKIIEEVEYKPGRILMFPGHIPHRGLAPTNPYVYRYSTVFRVHLDDLDRFF
tara:strand:+ start:162 stop:743 length:582 start_codon:yes stop_codon:yes gene_type:complete